MHVVVIETQPLGDRSYLVHDGTVAIVIDPQRDVDRVDAAAAAEGVQIAHVAETHVHNDYLTGGLVLARQHDAAYLINAADDVSHERTPIAPGQTVTVGQLAVEVVSTPGHTDTHVAYIVREGTERAVFSGGSLLFGSVGRTDLVAAERAGELAATQYASVRRLAERAGSQAVLYPTHGFGSYCSAGPPTGATASTIGHELRHNHALTDHDVEHFVASLLAGLSAYPTYYAHMGAANLAGPGPAELAVPVPLHRDDLRKRIEAGNWVVDLRNRVSFAADHLTGTVSFEYGDGGSFTSYLGWVVPVGADLTLLGTYDDVERAIRDLSRIGFDLPAVVLGGATDELGPGLPTGGYPRLSWSGIQAIRSPDDVVVDVRRADEYEAGHVAGAVNIPMPDVLERMPELPRDRRLLIHCESGYRSGVVASMLETAGFDVVHVDDRFKRAPE